MRTFSISNLRPSDAIYLKENLGDPKVQERFLEQLSTYLGQHGACEHSLDQVFCAAVELKNCDIAEQISSKKLDEVFNGLSLMGVGPRTKAFIEGLGSSYNGQIKLTTKQRCFTR